jgi:hypothetical protein
VSNFSQGLAAVKLGSGYSGKLGYIDYEGNVVIAPQYDGNVPVDESEFSEGLAYVRDSSQKSCYFIGRTGKTIIDGNSFGFSWGRKFSEGLAAIKFGDYFDGEWGFIDKNGEIVIKPVFGNVGSFSEGLARAKNGDGKWGYIDKTGDWVIRPEFMDTGDFSNGLAKAKTDIGWWGYIDKSGSFIIDPEFEGGELGDFSEGLAAVEVDGVVGFIDQEGRTVIEPKFTSQPGDVFNKFKGGLAPVSLAIDAQKGIMAGSIGGVVVPVSATTIVYWRGYINKAGDFVYKSKYSISLSGGGY